jgi:hypothetical protein
LLKIDKPVKIYFNFEYIKTIKYSLIDFVKENLSGKLLTWIPANFETTQTMVEFLDKHIKNELALN